MSSAAKSEGSAVALFGLFIAWYAFNAGTSPKNFGHHFAPLYLIFISLFFIIGYNVYNAFLKVFAYPLAIATLQLGVGMFYAIPLWILGIRKAPKITISDLFTLLPIACLNAAGHACAVIAMFQKGGGSFTHVIKASEPVVSVILGLLINGAVPKPITALTLLPITYGVAYASTLGDLNVATMSKELTTLTAKMALGSNVAFALRSIFKSKLPKDFAKRTNLDPANEHAVSTLLSFLLTAPFVYIFEGGEGGYKALDKGFNALADKNAFLMNVAICGMCFYLYNEMQNIVLGSLGPVPTAVGNTLKRVAIFVALYFFTAGETFPMPKIIGCAIAIVGCLAYAICNSMKI